MSEEEMGILLETVKNALSTDDRIARGGALRVVQAHLEEGIADARRWAVPA